MTYLDTVDEPYRGIEKPSPSAADIARYGKQPEVELDKDDLEMIADLATSRAESYGNRSTVALGDFETVDVEDIHEIGLIGEYAVLKHAKPMVVDHDLDEIDDYGDDGHDLIFAGQGNRTVDVKTTATTATDRPMLAMRPGKSVDCDLYIQTHVLLSDGAGVKVRLCGWTTGEILDKKSICSPRDRNIGPCRYMHQRYLHPIPTREMIEP